LDPVTLILGALTSGAAQGVAESAADSVKDAYGKLKGLVARRFAGNKTAEVALAEHADDPGTWQAPLAKALTESGVCADPAIIDAARQLMALLDEAGTRAGKYNVDLRGAQGVQVGDGNQQVNLFSARPEVP
jgi:hypothetical protein